MSVICNKALFVNSLHFGIYTMVLGVKESNTMILIVTW